MRTPSLFVVGAGRLGLALAAGLAARRWHVAAFARSPRGRARLRRRHVPSLPLASATAFDLVFLAVPDREIAAAARAIAPHVRRAQIVAHGSGALTLEPLAPVRSRGAHVGSLHPMQALAGRSLTAGVYAALEGDRAALRVLSRAGRDLGLLPVRVPERGRVLYHAASAIAANLCMALADLATETWVASGAPREQAVPALVPLLRGAVENLARRGLSGALTGPVSRGDVETVARHLRALRGDAAEVYRLLSLRLVDVALRGGLEPAAATELRTVLRGRGRARQRVLPAGSGRGKLRGRGDARR